MIEEPTGFKPGSKAWKQFMQKLYGIGASVVIIGALFKIQHWEFASEMLIVGLGTEALIFFISASMVSMLFAIAFFSSSVAAL